MNPFARLIGQSVIKVIELEDQLTISFSAGDVLSIYNSWQLHELDVSALMGQRATRVDMKNDSLGLVLLKGSLRVDLSDEGYNGPEALLLTGLSGKPFVVC